MVLSLKRSRALQHMAGDTLSLYLKLVKATSSEVFEPENFYAQLKSVSPAIIALWHGEHLLTPLAGRPDIRTNVLISKSADGEINARVAEKWGAGTIRGSGTFKRAKISKKGGVQAFRAMLEKLEAGENIMLTADVPKLARVAGPGIITLAQKSGRPVVPMAVASSRFIRLGSWDRAALNLPFSRLCFALGEPLWVPQDAGDDVLEERRDSLTQALDEITSLAYQKLLRVQ